MNKADEPSLFEIPECLSPKLKWIRGNQCLTFHSLPGEPDHLWMAAFDSGDWKYENSADYFFQETSHNGESRLGTGETEAEAIMDLCLRSGVKHWTLQ